MFVKAYSLNKICCECVRVCVRGQVRGVCVRGQVRDVCIVENDGFCEYKHNNPITSLDGPHANNSLISVTTHEEKAPTNIISNRLATTSRQFDHPQHFLPATHQRGMLAPAKNCFFMSLCNCFV